MRLHRAFLLLLIALACALAISIRLQIPVSAVTCVNPDSLPRKNAWTTGAAIAVNISKFPASLQSCVQTAFSNWNTANTSNGSGGVKFQTTINDSPVTTGSSGGTNVYQVTYQTPIARTATPSRALRLVRNPHRTLAAQASKTRGQTSIRTSRTARR
jgi:hypothetical protein